MRLEELQRRMVAAIDYGPDHIAWEAFLGGRLSTLRGLSVHANTVSHARLTAIEDTFPRTRVRLGDGEFNRLSRAYLELAEAKSEPLTWIGRQFPAWLTRQDLADAAALAAFEWAWLEAYHAAEAEALELFRLAGLTEDNLLQTIVARHPAARLVAPVRDKELESAVPDLANAHAILITRPDANVLVAPATAPMAQQFDLLNRPRRICNLLESGDEPGGEDSLQALFAMLGAGSLVLT